MAANFRGMWKPQKKPLSKMDREEVVKELRSFRNAWEKITTRDQDLSNERLKEESLTDLRKLLKFYYTEDAKTLAKKWLKIPLDDSDVIKSRRSRIRPSSSGSGSQVRKLRKSERERIDRMSGKKSRSKKSVKKSGRKSRAKKSRSDRPSPKLSATLFDKGQIKKGNDGNKWTVIVTSSGIHRWKKL
jgi:hypothetical protein